MSNVRASGIAGVRCRQSDRLSGDSLLVEFRTARDPLDRVAIRITRLECHLCVYAGWIFAQDAFSCALMLDKLLPIALSDPAEACDAVGRDQRSQGKALGGAGGRIGCTEPFFSEPLLECHKGRHCTSRRPQLLQEARDERWRHRRMLGDKSGECRPHRFLASL